MGSEIVGLYSNVSVEGESCHLKYMVLGVVDGSNGILSIVFDKWGSNVKVGISSSIFDKWGSDVNVGISSSVCGSNSLLLFFMIFICIDISGFGESCIFIKCNIYVDLDMMETWNVDSIRF